MPDVQGKLDEIITLVETAKGKALSGSAAVVDRGALLSALEDLRALLPAEMSEARSLLRERESVQDAARIQADELLGNARAEADRIVADGRQELARLVSESAVVEEADRVAAEITTEAEAQAVRMRRQTDAYIDASLARFEDLLSSSLETVARGRARVAAAHADAALAKPDRDDPTDPVNGLNAVNDADPIRADAGYGDPGDPADPVAFGGPGPVWDSRDQQEVRTT
jgi:cell division septum initiation protein DivIVA